MIGRVAAPAAAKAVASAPVQAIWGAQRGVVEMWPIAGLNQAVLMEAMKYGVRKEVVAWAKAHPTIVPFINADKDMIHSIAETGWTRCIQGTASSYFTTNFKPTNGTPFEILYHSIMQKNNARQLEGWNSGSGWWGINSNGSSFGKGGSGVSISTTTKSEVKVSYTSGSSCALTLNGTNAGSPSMSFVTFNWGNIVGWGSKECCIDKKIDLTITENGYVRNMYIPCLHNGNMELLDVVTGNFATRVGTFTQSLEQDPQE